MKTSGRDLIVNRELVFGNDKLLRFDLSQYAALKRIFETIHVADYRFALTEG